MRPLLLATPALIGIAAGHGDHGYGSQKPIVDENADWMTRHMAGNVLYPLLDRDRTATDSTRKLEEHHMSEWDADSFFTLHDYNSDNIWQADELQRTYGLFDESNDHLSPEKKDQVLHDLMILLDTDEDQMVTREEWHRFILDGKTLPDLGVGPGHHGDYEYEYEIHHWEK